MRSEDEVREELRRQEEYQRRSTSRSHEHAARNEIGLARSAGNLATHHAFRADTLRWVLRLDEDEPEAEDA